ncbi:MAG: ABC transporter permease [Gemmatimonadaceae bacterium]
MRTILTIAVRLLLRLFPGSFRERHGAEYLATLRALGEEPRYQGIVGGVRLGAFVIPDLLRALVSAWNHTGSVDALKSRPTGGMMESLWQDLRYAVRTLSRSPVFALTVVLSLGLGIGANTIVYSLLDGVVLNPFAYPDADRMVGIGVTFPKVSSDRGFIESLSPHEFVDVRDSTASLERVSAFDLGNRAISGGDRPERVFTAFVWGDPLSTLGFTPALGRSFRPAETEEEGNPVAMISYRVWQARFAGDSSIIGREIRVNGQPSTVIGVMPAAALLMGTDLWLPMGVAPLRIPRQARQYAIIARLKPDASLEAANSDLARIATRTERAHLAQFKEYEGWRLEAVPFAEATTSQFHLRLAGFVMQGAVALLLLIGCTNVASLLLSRAASRAPEISVRQALGARTRRLLRQLFTESLLLAVAGGVFGLIIARAAIGPLGAALPEQVSALGIRVAINERVLSFTLLVSLAVGVFFGASPIAQVLRNRTSAVLGQSGVRMTLGKRGRRLRAGFLAVQVALSLILLVGAGLLLRSFNELQNVDLGFDARGVLTARMSLARDKYSMAQVGPFFEQLAERLRAIPGVKNASAATQYPPNNVFQTNLQLRGETAELSAARMVDLTNATPEFFSTIGYRVRAGRLFGKGDTENAALVAVINETAARRFFPGRSPVGERVTLGQSETPTRVEIVGVVADVRNRGLEAPTAPEVFMPARQQREAANNQLFIQVRAVAEPLPLVGSIRDLAKELDSDQPLYAISTIERDLGNALLQRRAAMFLIGIFALIALILASVGIYGLVSQSVQERVREIGIRMALGAEGRTIALLVMRQILTVVGIGCALGLAASIALSGSMRSLVFGVSATDPFTLVGVFVLLTAVAACAAAIPAIRAARVLPVTAVRAD